MTHIMRIDEMSVRYTDIIDNRLSAEKNNGSIKLKNFKDDAKKVLKKFYSYANDMTDAIDTMRDIMQKGAVKHLRGNYLTKADDTINKPVFKIDEKSGLCGIVYYNGYTSSMCPSSPLYKDCFYFTDGVLYICRHLRYDGKTELKITAEDSFDKASLDGDTITMPIGSTYYSHGCDMGDGLHFYKMLLDFTNQINDFTIDFFNDVQSL